jgi:pyruvate,water dikinase
MADGLLVTSDQLYHQDTNPTAKAHTDRITITLSQLHGNATKPILYQITDNDSTPFGYRGAIKHLRQPEQLKIELEALRRFEATHYAHAFLILPSTRTQHEYAALIQLLNGSGLDLGSRTKLWLSCNVPATLFLLEQFLTDDMINGVFIDLDELTQHTLGADTTHKQLAGEYDMHDSAVITALEHAAQICREQNTPLTVRIPEGVQPELLEALVALGITSLIVPADEVQATRTLLASTEQRLILNHVVAELHTESEHEHSHA